MNNITQIQILGERCSGTNYLQKLCELNFAGIEKYQPFGWKHAFFPKLKKDTTQALFIVIVRNPFDWVRSLHQYPHHAPKTMHNIPFSEFIRNEWYCVWNEDAGVKPGDEKYNTEMMIERDPNTKQRIANALKLRAAKMRHHKELEQRVEHTYYTTLEELESNWEKVLRDIHDTFGIELKQEQIVNVETYKGAEKKKFEKKKYAPISEEDLSFMKEQLDWDLENTFGYSFEDYEDD